MSIITISRGSYSNGKEVAEKVAEKLNYECISRDILLAASKEFNIPEIRLVRALHDAPSVLDRFSYGKERYVAYIRYAFLDYVQKDNIVYHGLAGQYFIQDVPHALKVRIIANLEDRVKEEMKREDIAEDEARYQLKKDDEERRKWSMSLYGIDTWDPNLYDLVIHIDTLGVEEAVDLICRTAEYQCFQTTEDSKHILQQKLLAAHIKADLAADYPTAKVNIERGNAYINVQGRISNQEKIQEDIRNKVRDYAELKKVEVFVNPVVEYGAY
jgi:cytidylate kinase